MRRVAVFGLGYVGSVTAACLARDGHRVIGVDIAPHKLKAIRQGRAPVVEPGLDPLIAKAITDGNLSVTDNTNTAVCHSDMAIITVGTPSRPDGSVGTEAVENVVRAIGISLRKVGRPYVVVIRSTLLPGLLEERLEPILRQSIGESSYNAQVELCNNPEFLRETTAVADYNQPPFILVGADNQHAAAEVLSLYENIPGERIVTDTRTAAMVKYACNAFHALKIDFANEIATVAAILGADPQEVMRIVRSDRRLNISTAYLKPGMSFGGSCLPKDVQALVRAAQQWAVDVPLLRSLLPSNQAHFRRALAHIRQAAARRIGIVGLSFKPHTDDLRDSPMVYLAEALLGMGYELKILDPSVQQSRLVGSNLAFVDRHLPHLARLLVTDEKELLEHAELLVFGTSNSSLVNQAKNLNIPIIDLNRDIFGPPAEYVSAYAPYRTTIQE